MEYVSNRYSNNVGYGANAFKINEKILRCIVGWVKG